MFLFERIGNMKKSNATIVDISEEEHLALREKYKDYVGYHNNRLTIVDIIGRDPRHVLYIEAKCECGETICVTNSAVRNGSVKSCGCIAKEVWKTSQEYKVPDLVGQVFSYLTVERRASDEESGIAGTGAKWLCRCKCNRIRYATTGELNAGTVKSCKVCSRPIRGTDLSGKIINNVEVIERTGRRNSYRQAMWKCLCHACNNYFETSSAVLVHSNIYSCGCVSSKGEKIIADFLSEHNIRFEKQKTFIGCKNKNRLRFDLWLPEFGTCIEYDGIQHFKKSNEWDSDEKFKTRRQNDTIKDKWCAENGVTLCRIPYYETNKIESILRDWLFL